MSFTVYRWVKICIINLLIVAILGNILRYKIAFSLPFIDQKHLLHGHSHFAFAGWVSQTLMVLMVAYLSKQAEYGIFKKYHWILMANLLTAYAMLVAFPIQGYGLYSIIFSTLSVIVSYLFSIMYWRDLNRLKEKCAVHLWFKAALLFNAISSLGAYALAFMMVKKIIHQNWYLASEYFFLHFQYNGWFFFAGMGLITGKLFSKLVPEKKQKAIFWLFALALVPAYFLSTLWMPLPAWVYVLIVIAAIAQVAAWVWMIKIIKQQLHFIVKTFSLVSRWLLGLSAIALSIKLLLQLGSVIPSLSILVFGFRPIVIGYLHLVLLCVISLFLLGFLFAEKMLVSNKKAIMGVALFTFAIIFNEALLMIQGVAAIGYIIVPYIDYWLLAAAALIFIAVGLLLTGQKNHIEFSLPVT